MKPEKTECSECGEIENDLFTRFEHQRHGVVTIQ